MNRDLDLQAILDAPDSDTSSSVSSSGDQSPSSESESNVIDDLPLFAKNMVMQGQVPRTSQSSSKSKNEKISTHLNPTNNKSSNYSTNLDLEKILMENDDDDEDEDDNDNVYNYSNHDNINKFKRLDENYHSHAAIDDNFSLGASTIPTLPSQLYRSSPPSTALRKRAGALLSTNSNNIVHHSPSREGIIHTDGDKHNASMSTIDDNLHSPDMSTSDKLHDSTLSSHSPPSKMGLKKGDDVYDMPRLSMTSNVMKKESNHYSKQMIDKKNINNSKQNKDNYIYSSSRCRNAEEWSVLQSILNDDDDDDPDVSFEILDLPKRGNLQHTNNEEGRGESKEVYMDEYVNTLSSRRNMVRVQSNTSSAADVDAILFSMDSDSDDDANLADLEEMIANFSFGVTRTAKTNSRSTRNNPIELKSGDVCSLNKLPNMSSMNRKKNSKLQNDVQIQSVSSNEQSITKQVDLTKEYFHQHNSVSSTLKSSDSLTEAALKYAEEYERRLLKPGNRDIVSPLMVKRRMKPKIELETKSRGQQQQQQQVFSSKKKTINQFSQQSQYYNFSGMIDSKSMERIGDQLHQYSQLKIDEIGLPTAIAVSSKFIAIGTQRGIILVFDLFEVLRQQLGLPIPGNTDITPISMKKHGSVSSMDLSSNGENLVAGYTSGCIVLWDVIKGTIVKTVADMHPSPITSLRFISSPLSIVSIDAGGLVNKISFTKPLLWTTYNVESECLLDGTAGQILAFSVLPPISSLNYVPMNLNKDKKQSYHPSVEKIVLIALSSARSSFAIAVEPTVSVLHRWTKPTEKQMNLESFLASRNSIIEDLHSMDSTEPQAESAMPEVFLPCLAWNWAIVSGGENSVTPILARGWGCSIQFLIANFPTYVEGEKIDESILWPAFGDHDEFQSTAPVVALEWMGNRSLLFLTLTNELTVVDTVMMTLMERLDFSGIKLVYAEFALSRNVKTQDSNHKESAPTISTTFQNSIRANEDRILVLCQEELKTISIVQIQQRIAALEEDGEWLEALALALDHYEGSIKSQEDRRRDSDNERDISHHPEFLSKMRKTTDEEWIADLLIRYLNLAVENAPESVLNTSTAFRKKYDKKNSSSKIDLAQSHFQMLAGVCIEFCIVTRRLDILFNDVYDQFRRSGYTVVFLDVLEPYILNDKLQYIAPEVMSQFVEHCKLTNDVSTVERCLLHMDVTIMDFDSILSLLRKNNMFSALTHVYTHGLNDFVSPLEILFEAIFDEANAGTVKQRRQDGVPQSKLERYGYKAILYLRYCFTNRSFPQGLALPEHRIDTLRQEILCFLKAKIYKSPSRKQKIISLGTFRHVDYPYIRVLMMIDTKAFLDTLSLVFDTPGARFEESIDVQQSIEDWHDVLENINENDSTVNRFDTMEGNYITCPDRMDFARILSLIVNSLESINTMFGNVDQRKVTINAYHDFMAKYLLRGVFRTPPALTMSIISRMASRFAQEEIIKLLQILPRNTYNREKVLEVVENVKMSRAALVLYKNAVVELFEGSCSNDAGATNFIRAIDCYLQDKDSSFRLGAFDYIKKECIGGSTFRTDGDERTIHDVLRNALCIKFADLVNLDPVLSAQLVAEIYIEELDTILKALENSEEGMVTFKFFNAVISGDLSKIDAVAGPVLLAHLTIDHHQQYLDLMARFHPDMVYHHLISNDNYRADECLQLCQAHDIADASAYLLEKMGNVSSALQLMLQTLEGRMMNLKRVVRGLSTSSYPSLGRKLIRINHVMKVTASTYFDTKEAHSVRQILTVALDLCERNSSSSSNVSGHGSQLWFNVLDRLINAKGFLRLAKELPEHSEIMLNVLSSLLKMTMERMVSNVPLPDLVRKITTDHAGNRLGEFREMITTMLSTYGSELDVCRSAVNVMNNDVQKLSSTKFSLKMRGERVMYINGKSMSQIDPYLFQNLPQGSILHVNSGKATLAAFDEGILQQENMNSIDSALIRIRSKRKRIQSRQSKRSGKQSTLNFGMTTSMDKRFANGESSDAAYMPRYIGMLSDAEHFGRL